MCVGKIADAVCPECRQSLTFVPREVFFGVHVSKAQVSVLQMFGFCRMGTEEFERSSFYSLQQDASLT